MVPEDEASSFPDRFEVVGYKDGFVLSITAFGARKEEISSWWGFRRVVRLWTSSSAFILRTFTEPERKHGEQKYESSMTNLFSLYFSSDGRTEIFMAMTPRALTIGNGLEKEI